MLFCLVPIWWGYLDLNQGPIGYEPTALTTELYPHGLEKALFIEHDVLQNHGAIIAFYGVK